MTRVAAVQSWPALKYPAIAMSAAAFFRSASAKTTTGALPPSSRCVRAKLEAAAAATSLPARTDPVTEHRAGVGCRTSIAPVSLAPQTTLMTPGGRISPISLAMSSVDTGVVSEGFSTTQLPAAIAGAHFHTAIMIG